MEESYEILWKSVREHLETSISAIFFGTYIANLMPVDIVGNRIVLIADSKMNADVVTDKKGDQIRDALLKCNNDVTDFSIVVAKSKEEYLTQAKDETYEETETQGTAINPKFTFDSFVVGDSNHFMFGAAKAVAEQPSDAYNPLFISGGTGLGKTHILMAIANHIKKTKPALKVLYVTCEQFTNQLIESLSKGKGGAPTLGFHKKFRSVDVLLIDDVQFLAKKQGVQTEFFHTFNELVLQNKQIVLTSDRPPKEIEVLEERLRTRFEGGLLVDVQNPDFETKVAILKKKAVEQKSIIDIKVLSYIAEMSDGDIRSLIGKLTKVIFASKLHEVPVTINLVNAALQESASEKQEELQVEDIINCVANFYKISKNDMLGKKKSKEFSEPRQICTYLITEMMNLPLVTIGEKMGGRDYSTIIYSRDKISEEIKANRKLATDINDIKKMLLKQ